MRMMTLDDDGIQELRRLLRYDPEAGTFTRLVKRGPFEAGTFAAAAAGKKARRVLRLGALRVSAAAAAYAMVTGRWPAKRVKLLNNDESDLRFENLYVCDGAPLTAERLRAFVSYDPLTGEFTRLVNTAPMGRMGQAAGSLAKPHNRIELRVDGKLYKAHRLAWLYMTGEWPRHDIDHVDGDSTNNRWANLRDVDARTNGQNRRRPQKNNKLGLLGVCQVGDQFLAQIRDADANRNLGLFESAEQAHQAYLAAKRALHDGCTI